MLDTDAREDRRRRLSVLATAEHAITAAQQVRSRLLYELAEGDPETMAVARPRRGDHWTWPRS